MHAARWQCARWGARRRKQRRCSVQGRLRRRKGLWSMRSQPDRQAQSPGCPALCSADYPVASPRCLPNCRCQLPHSVGCRVWSLLVRSSGGAALDGHNSSPRHEAPRRHIVATGWLVMAAAQRPECGRKHIGAGDVQAGHRRQHPHKDLTLPLWILHVQAGEWRKNLGLEARPRRHHRQGKPGNESKKKSQAQGGWPPLHAHPRDHTGDGPSAKRACECAVGWNCDAQLVGDASVRRPSGSEAQPIAEDSI